MSTTMIFAALGIAALVILKGGENDRESRYGGGGGGGGGGLREEESELLFEGSTDRALAERFGGLNTQETQEPVQQQPVITRQVRQPTVASQIQTQTPTRGDATAYAVYDYFNPRPGESPTVPNTPPRGSVPSDNSYRTTYTVIPSKDNREAGSGSPTNPNNRSERPPDQGFERTPNPPIRRRTQPPQPPEGGRGR